MGTTFAEMSSWTALTRHLRMKTKIMMILNLFNIILECILREAAKETVLFFSSSATKRGWGGG